ncbi:MAG: hypothetical protein ACRDSS_13075 [Actinocrinis sp.]
MRWIDTYRVQIIPRGAGVFGIFLVRRSSTTTMPRQLPDAAALVGAGRIRVLRHVGPPKVRPAPVVIAINVVMAVPVMDFFPVLQRQFVRGALSAAGGLRG